MTRDQDRKYFDVVREVGALVAQLESTVDAITALLQTLDPGEDEDAGDRQAD